MFSSSSDRACGRVRGSPAGLRRGVAARVTDDTRIPSTNVFSNEVRSFASVTLRQVRGSAAVTKTNRRNDAPRGHHGLYMMLFWLMWLSLVLGGVAGGLWSLGAVRWNRLRVARVVARGRLPVGQQSRPWGRLLARSWLAPPPGGRASRGRHGPGTHSAATGRSHVGRPRGRPTRDDRLPPGHCTG